jgi:hypothetical protein
MVACEASGAREHGHDSKQEHQVEGPIMQAKEWTRAFGRCNKWSMQAQKSQRGDDRARRKNRARGARTTPGRSAQAGRPTPVGLPYKWQSPVPVFCRQATLSFLYLCAQVFESRTTIDLAILPKLASSNNSHP